MPRFLGSLFLFVAAAVAWVSAVTAIGIWWTSNHPPIGTTTDTYFITSSWVYRLALLIPLLLVAMSCWRRGVRSAT